MGLTQKLVVSGMLLGALAVSSGKVDAGDGEKFMHDLIKGGVRQGVMSEVQTNIEGPRGTTVNNNFGGNNGFVESYVNPSGLSKDDARVLREVKGMNRIVPAGDLDGDGAMDFYFYDEHGNGYGARRVFKTDDGEYSFTKENGSFRETFVYYIGRKAKRLPKGTLIIWDRDKGQ
jgi:hypothetical protein